MNTKDYKQLLDKVYKPGRKPSLHYLILSYFIDGGELSVLSALREFKSIELRKIVSDLRKMSIPIEDKWQTAAGSKKRYKVYRLTA